MPGTPYYQSGARSRFAVRAGGGLHAGRQAGKLVQLLGHRVAGSYDLVLRGVVGVEESRKGEKRAEMAKMKKNLGRRPSPAQPSQLNPNARAEGRSAAQRSA